MTTSPQVAVTSKHVGNHVADQGVVAAHRQRRRQVHVNALAVVVDLALFAVVGARNTPQRAAEYSIIA